MSSEKGATVAVLLAFAVALYAEALARLRRHERATGDAPGRWFGYGRDAVNLVAASVLVGIFAWSGFDAPSAILLGASLGIIEYIADFVAGRWLDLRRSRVLVTSLAGIVGLIAIAARASLSPRLDALIAGATAR